MTHVGAGLVPARAAARAARTRGFTLIELLTSVVILTFGIIAVHQAFSRCIAAVRHSEERLYCAFLLERRAVELLISSPEAAMQGGFEEPAEKDFTLKDTISTVIRGDEAFVLHSLEAAGPSGVRLTAPLLTPIPEKER